MVVSLIISSLSNHLLSTFSVSGAVLGPGKSVEEDVLDGSWGPYLEPEVTGDVTLRLVYLLRVPVLYSERT